MTLGCQCTTCTPSLDLHITPQASQPLLATGVAIARRAKMLSWVGALMTPHCVSRSFRWRDLLRRFKIEWKAVAAHLLEVQQTTVRRSRFNSQKGSILRLCVFSVRTSSLAGKVAAWRLPLIRDAARYLVWEVDFRHYKRHATGPVPTGTLTHPDIRCRVATKRQ